MRHFQLTLILKVKSADENCNVARIGPALQYVSSSTQGHIFPSFCVAKIKKEALTRAGVPCTGFSNRAGATNKACDAITIPAITTFHHPSHVHKMPGPSSGEPLNILQRELIVEEYHRRKVDKEPYDQDSIAKWAVKALRLSTKPSQSTISRVLHKYDPSLSLGITKNRHRLCPASCPQIEKALFCWVNSQFALRRNVSGDMIKAVGMRVMTKMNLELPEEKHLSLKFSNGWLYRFQARYGLHSFRSHEESGDADLEAISTSLKELQDIAYKYQLRDLFNADEFGHCYQMAPETTITQSRMPGRKKQKVRLTYLACCNANGTERFPQMVRSDSR